MKAKQIIKLVTENIEDDFSVDDFIADQGNVPKICVSYYRTIPNENASGDFDFEEESGWENEEGVPFSRDDAESPDEFTTNVANWLNQEGVCEASSRPWTKGAWYQTDTQQNYRTGAETSFSFHLKGFTEEEEQEIYNKLKKKKRLW